LSAANSTKIYDLIPGYKNTDNQEHFLYLLKLVNLAIFSSLKVKPSASIKQLVIKGLQNKNGTTREAARKIAGNMSFIYRTESAAHQEKLLLEIEPMIKIYEPKTIPHYIDNAKPSIYKTLVLVWHDIICTHQLYEKLNYLERMVSLDIPPYSNGEDEEEGPAEELYSMNDWQESIEDYFECTKEQWAETEKILKLREAESLKFLKWSLTSNHSLTYLDTIIIAAQKGDSVTLSHLLSGIIRENIGVSDNREEEVRAVLILFDKVARAIQSIDNNTVLATSRGNAFNRLLTSLAMQESYKSSPKLVELLPLMESFELAHSEIDSVVTRLFIPAENSIRKIIKKHDPEREIYTVDYSEYVQTAHYMLDWLLQIDYKIITRKTPKQLSATIWSVLLADINIYNPVYGYEHQALAEYGEWANSSSLSGSCRLVREKLLYGMSDPAILQIPYSSFNF